MADRPDQLGLFSDLHAPRGHHLVTAHTRVRADGTEVFVAEHVRWNRGRRPPGAPAPRRPPPTDARQLPLLLDDPHDDGEDPEPR